MNTRQICAVWSAYRGKLLPQFLDVRVYFALHEMAERRSAAVRTAGRKTGKDRVLRLERGMVVAEARKLLGVASAARVRASLRRLESLGLVQITQTQIRFSEEGEQWGSSEGTSPDELLERIDRRERVRERSLPIPRRTLRFLAGNGRPAVAATMLGHMIRSLWWHEGCCHSIGCCSTGFVVHVFGVHERNVKRARAELRRMGWLTPVAASSRRVNSHGAKAVIKLAWSGEDAPGEFPTGTVAITKSPPPGAPCVTKSPPPISKRTLPSGSENHNPACRGAVGVRKRRARESKPDLRRVQPLDLRDAKRLGSLFDQAVSVGLVQGSFADRLRFFAAAEHARRVGRQNPCGLFATVVRRGLWAHASQADEDRALNALRQCERRENTQRVRGLSCVVAMASHRHAADAVEERSEFITALVRDLGSRWSFDVAVRGRRKHAPCDDLRAAAE